MLKVFSFYSDPGHGWSKVPKALLQNLGIISKISRYSYMRKEFAYLEEDCDLSLFIRAYRAKQGIDPIFREAGTREKRSKVRSYDNFEWGF
jgi:hypothetical protein